MAKSHLQEAMEVTARAIEKEPHNPHARLAMAVHMGRWRYVRRSLRNLQKLPPAEGRLYTVDLPTSRVGIPGTEGGGRL